MSTPEKSKWQLIIDDDPQHSHRYVQRFKDLAAEGRDLHGEARFIDSMASRGARILDAGCGPGRVGGELHRLGHEVVGVDLDPVLIDAAHRDEPGPTWLVRDLASLDLRADGITDGFEVIVCAGNVMAFVAPSTRREVLSRLGQHLADHGRLVIAFGSGRDYQWDEFFADVAAAGLRQRLVLSTWDVQPFTADSDFIVAVLDADQG